MLEYFLLDCGLAIITTLYFIYYIDYDHTLTQEERCI